MIKGTMEKNNGGFFLILFCYNQFGYDIFRGKLHLLRPKKGYYVIHIYLCVTKLIFMGNIKQNKHKQNVVRKEETKDRVLWKASEKKSYPRE